MQESLREEKFHKEFLQQSSVKKRYLRNGFKTPQPRTKDVSYDCSETSSSVAAIRQPRFSDTQNHSLLMDKVHKSTSNHTSENPNNTPNTFNKLISLFKITKKLVYEIYSLWNTLIEYNHYWCQERG